MLRNLVISFKSIAKDEHGVRIDGHGMVRFTVMVKDENELRYVLSKARELTSRERLRMSPPPVLI